jgi:hypothetical protein
VIDRVTTCIGIRAGLLTGNRSSKIELIATDLGYHGLQASRPYDISLVLKLWLTAFVGSPIEDAVRTWSGGYLPRVTPCTYTVGISEIAIVGVGDNHARK